jgi:hypothetical protein
MCNEVLSAVQRLLRPHGFADADVTFTSDEGGGHRHDANGNCVFTLRCSWRLRRGTMARIEDDLRHAAATGRLGSEVIFQSAARNVKR